MSSNTLASRLSSLKTKTAELTVQEVKVPDSSADILTLFQGNSAARSDSSNEWIIDVFPNMIPIIMYVMLMSLQHAGLTEHRVHAKTSVATIGLYHMTIVYGFFLLNDLYVRPFPSAHARAWSQTSWKNEFAVFLLSLPVPEFLVPILSQLHACQTERTKNVFFIPSAAGFEHNQFFGRFIPLNFFSEIHDCTATVPGNTPRLQVLHDLFSRILYSTPTHTYQIPHFIGVTIDQHVATTANTFNSKLYQIFTSVFNPVLFRDFQRRSSLASINLKAPVYTTATPNAYDVLFSSGSSNLREMKVVLQAVSSILSSHVVCKQTLGQFISSASGNAILKHGYSTYALPTWSSNYNLADPNAFTFVTLLHTVNEDERAADISFLQTPPVVPPQPILVDDVYVAANADPGIPVDLPAGHQIVRTWPWSLRRTMNPANFWPSATNNEHFIQFDDSLHTNPRVLVLDTDGDKTVTAHLATLTGKILESFELDGSTIELPDVRKSLGMQNCLFADSAIPYKYVQPATEFYPRAANSLPGPIHRSKPNSQPRLPASSLLHDRTTIMLPVLRTHVVEPVLPATLPGMTPRNNAYWLRYVQSFLGFRTVDGSNNAIARDSAPATPDARLLLWSPYTYTPYEDDDEPLPDLSQSRHYYLTNLRTIFGTDFNLIEIKHPYEALPVV
jgi:hypothetical protein